MNRNQKVFGLALILIVIAAVAFGATGALAQQGGDTAPAPTQWGMRGMMQDDFQETPMWSAIADALGLDVDTLLSELHSGSSLPQIAEAHNVDIQHVYDAVLADMGEHMNEMVAAGFMTQAQADERLTWMRDHLAEMPMFAASGFGYGAMGGMMSGGWNMMGGMPMQGMMGMMGMHNMMGQGMRGGMMSGMGMHGMMGMMDMMELHHAN